MKVTNSDCGYPVDELWGKRRIYSRSRGLGADEGAKVFAWVRVLPY